MASAQDTTTGDLAGETTGTGTLPPLPRNTVRAGAVAARAPGTWVDAGVAEFVVRVVGRHLAELGDSVGKLAHISILKVTSGE